MTTLQDIQERLESEYNRAMSVYVYDTCVRLTNGSMAMYVDIKPVQDELVLHGERYGERIDKTCERDTDAMMDTLRSTI